MVFPLCSKTLHATTASLRKHEVYEIIVWFSEMLGAATVPDKNVLVLAASLRKRKKMKEK